MVGDILQPTHLLFVLIVALLVLGPKRLPEVGRTLGSGIRDFRAAINGEATEHRDPEPSTHISPESVPEPVDAFTGTTAVQDEPPPPRQFATGVDTDDDAASQSAHSEPATPENDEPALSAPTSGFASALAASRDKPSGPDEPGHSTA